MKDERCVSKMEGKTNFSRSLQVYDTAQHCDTSNKYTPISPTGTHHTHISCLIISTAWV